MPHGTAAVHAVENAMGWAQHQEPTNKGRLMRNLTLGAEFLHSTLTHFYALAALDYVQGPPMPPWTPYFHDDYYHVALRSGISEETSAIADAVLQPTPWAAVIRDYVTALHRRRDAHVCAAMFSGSQPHAKDYVAGGVTHIPTQTEIDRYKILLYAGGNMSTAEVGSGTTEDPAPGTILHFIENNYIPLTTIVAMLYPEYDNSSNPGGSGWGAGVGNFLSYGGFHQNTAGTSHLLNPGWVTGAVGAGPSAVVTGNIDHTRIMQFTNTGYYTDAAMAPGDALVSTTPDPTKPSGYAPTSAYTWHKAPRFNIGTTGSPDYKAMEVGPLARMMVHGDYRPGMTFSSGATAGPTTYKRHADPALSGLTPPSFVAGVSTMDRHRARALEARKIALACAGWLDELAATTGYASGNVDTSKSYPQETSAATLGVGMDEAPRGSVGHWTQIRYNKIERYEVIAPTSWNGSGRDPSGNPGPIEKALEGIELSGLSSSGTNVPVEALRVVHSFDPCIACSIHTISKRGCKR